MSQDTRKQYKVLRPIGFSGRQERGTVVSMTDDEARAFGPEFVVPFVAGEEVADAPAKPTVETEDLSALKVAELREMAEGLGLDTDGTKADLVERITLHKNA